ncbi:hypothetical protein QJ043_05190 [Olsenella sp. YH-ols2217]|uniref:AbiEi antitoxin of type IV toxin-antitoxin system n=1 Tax=Kribbibacterium absianum TaxID=3044210 RepID=A0ABT6ZKA3_9ACTN|nr:MULTISPECIES: hypothetical protein [unclassified Olsenella]MDJ1122567.1 hypothetical protein [Olsenella sp. YH-ols2216]MDJ1129473.1 hypothetical protein [Olsenella sp. YH-ols2217]
MGDVAERVERLLDEAEQECRCAFARRPQEGSRLRRLYAAGELVRPLRGLYIRAKTWRRLSVAERHLSIVRGLSRRHPDWVFCDVSAALLLGLECPEAELDTVHVAVEYGSLAHRIPGLVRHEIDIRRARLVDGVPTLVADDLLFGCIRRLGFEDGLALADSALRVLGVAKEHLVSLFERGHKGCRGIRVARVVASQADARSENGGESKVRARLFELNRVVPELQVTFANPDGLGWYRVDYLWRLPTGDLVAGELDGKAKYRDFEMTGGRSEEEVRAAQALRDDRLERQGVRVMHFTFEQAMDPLAFPALLREFGIPMREVGEPNVDVIMTPRLPCIDHPRKQRFRVVAGYRDAGLEVVMLEAA